MSDAMARRDALADELADRGWEIVDTFGGLESKPSVVVTVPDLEIAGVTFDRVELTVTVTQAGLGAGRVEVSDDELDLSAEQRELLDDVAAEKLEGPEITVWEYEPGSYDDAVGTAMDEIQSVYDDVTPLE